MEFNVSEDVSSLGIRVVFLVIYNIDNTKYDIDLEDSIYSYYKKFYKSYPINNLERDRNIIGYRLLHNKIGITDKSIIASPESLIKLLFKYKSIKPINTIVDIYNYVSIKNKISIGGHDLDSIFGNVRLCFTQGNETFIPMGGKSPKVISEKHYCYMDDSDEIICWLDCRQCEKTKISTRTKNCLFIIQGHSEIPEQKLLSTAEELQRLIQRNTKENSKVILKLL